MKREKLLMDVTDLIKSSPLLEQEEKDYWINVLPNIKWDQMLKLINILVLEKTEEMKKFNETFLINYEEN